MILPNPEYCDKIFSLMKQQLPTDGKDMQILAAEGFVHALEKNKKLSIEVLMDIFHLCLVILAQWNTDVINEWIKIFNLVVSVLDWNFMKDKLSELVNQLSQSAQPKQSRYAAARIIESIAKVALHHPRTKASLWKDRYSVEQFTFAKTARRM